ncbi:MAG: DUF3105 domain-containing protein [Chloroflexi bacterium]|nr:DUF3105 domain-containing protein [Chloroflexota bacterium]
MAQREKSVGEPRGKAARTQVRQARQKQQRTRYIIIGIGVIILLSLVGYKLVTETLRSQPGILFADQGQTHIQPGEAHPAYNSDPPTSGWHIIDPAPNGYHEVAPPDEQLVHNLEHGHIVIYFNCAHPAAGDCNTLKNRIQDLAKSQQQLWKITIAPREKLDVPIILTAWRRMQKLEQFDEKLIVEFIQAYRDRGPEKTPN